jgi:hypothetical protein
MTFAAAAKDRGTLWNSLKGRATPPRWQQDSRPLLKQKGRGLARLGMVVPPPMARVKAGPRSLKQDWMGGYYLNNARFRILEILGKPDCPDVSARPSMALFDGLVDRGITASDDTRSLWNILHGAADELADALGLPPASPVVRETAAIKPSN